MVTKRDIVERAFADIGLAGYVFDLQPQQIDMAVKALDGIMFMWNGRGLRLSYNAGDAGTESGLSDIAIEPAVKALALRIAPGYGKTVSNDIRIQASEGFRMLMGRAAMPRPAVMDTMAVPAGAGNRHRLDDPYLVPDQEYVATGPDGDLGIDL